MTANTDQDVLPVAQTAAPLPRYKMAVINWISAYPLITFLLWVGQPLIQRVPVYLTTLVLSLTLVCLLTFVITPLMTKVFAGWLHQSGPRADR